MSPADPDRAYVTWRMLLYGFALPMVLFALALTFGYLRLQDENDRVEALRALRASDAAAATLENCVRNNFQDLRDRDQDRLLRDFLELLLDPKLQEPGAETAQAAARKKVEGQRATLTGRVDAPQPPFDEAFIRKYGAKPRDCKALAPERS